MRAVNVNTGERDDSIVKCIAICLVTLALTLSIPRAAPYDFVAFYCGAESLAHGADPYLAMPLGACEARYEDVTAVVPAPLPPYALRALSLLTPVPLLPLSVALTVATLLTAVSGVVALSRLTRVSVPVVATAVAIPAALSISLGQVVPVLFGALVLAGLLLEHDRDELAALLTLPLLIEPHVGLPVCASLALARPRTRIVLAIASTLCTLASIPWLIEYATRVIPLHAASEATWSRQLSLTSALTAVGLPEHFALTAGSAQYVAFVLLALVYSRRAAARYGGSAIALVPPAFAVLGGTFVHETQLLLAVPAALLLTRTHRIAFLAVLGIAIDSPAIDLPAITVLASLSALLLGFTYNGWRVAGLGAIVVLAAGIFASHLPWDVDGHFQSAITPGAYAEMTWSAYTHAQALSPAARIANLIAKVPSWLGLAAIVYIVAGKIDRVSRFSADRSELPVSE